MATRTIATRLAVDGETEYKKAMAIVNSELRTLSTEMKLTEAQFKGQANTLDALTAKDKILREELERQNKVVSETETFLKSAEKAQSELADAWSKAREKAEQAGLSVEDLKGNTKGLTEEQQELVKEVNASETAYIKISGTVQSYQQKLNRAKTDLIKFNGEISDNDRYLDEARSSADKCAKSIDGFGKEAKDAGGDLGGFGKNAKDMLGKLGDLKSMLAGGAVAVGVKELTGAIMELEESTREYRQIMGTLETSAEAAGYNAEQTAAAYERLYGVLGDNQSAATTLANLQAIGLGQTDLMTIIDQVTGAWATYGDSIPIDGLAESVNETIQAAKVTGTFADVLNWAGTNEDEFNEKLAACKDKTERANLVMQEMARQGLTQTSEAWRQNNADIVAMNEAQAKWEEATGKLGETLSPAAEALKSFGADAIGWVTDKINDGIEAVQGFLGWFKKINQTLNEDSMSRVEAGQAAQRARVDGSHAGGLDRVPFDGYVAQLHRDEAVLTAQENAVWQGIKAGNLAPARSGVTAEELRSAVVAAANAAGEMQRDAGGAFTAELTVKTEDGRTLGRYLVPFVRNEEKCNPEVVSDKV